MEFNMLKGKLTHQEIKGLNPLVLAYIGDAVYEVFVRTYIVSENKNVKVHGLHKLSINLVKAEGQSNMMKCIMDELNENETYIFKRGRNAKSGTVPKHADLIDYRMATGFEALIGYLYLIEDMDRLNYILEKSLSLYKEKRNNEK